MRKLLLILSSALLCASCSSYYANHARHHDAAEGVNRGDVMDGRFKHHPTSPAQGGNARTHGYDAGPRAEGYDDESREYLDNEVLTSAKLVKWSAMAKNNKCIPARPIGGIEQHYFFDFDRDRVESNGMSSIKQQAKYLIQHPKVVARVEGNADDRGSREYNVALGARRAKAIIAALKEQGVSDKQLNIVSYGAEKPALLGETTKAWQCNRRVDIVYEVR